MPDSFLSQVSSLSVLMLMVSADFKVGSRFWISGSISILVIKGGGCALREGQLNKLWASDNPILSGWEFKKSNDK